MMPTHMDNRPLYILLAFLLVAGFGEAGADVVILRSGEMIQTSTAWRENGEVVYFEGGQVVRIDEHEVERLIDDSAPLEAKPSPRHPAAGESPLPSDTLPSDKGLPPPCPIDDDAGYLELRWGRPLAQFEGLVEVATDPAYGGVKRYVHRHPGKRFGRAVVDEVVFGFWQDRLYTIVVQTSNFLDFRDLKAEVTRRYGAGRQNRDDVEKYYWMDKGTDRLLSYDYDSDLGFLWMRSRALHEKVRLHDVE
jgi:hypothetical protein